MKSIFLFDVLANLVLFGYWKNSLLNVKQDERYEGRKCFVFQERTLATPGNKRPNLSITLAFHNLVWGILTQSKKEKNLWFFFKSFVRTIETKILNEKNMLKWRKLYKEKLWFEKTENQDWNEISLFKKTNDLCQMMNKEFSFIYYHTYLLKGPQTS